MSECLANFEEEIKNPKKFELKLFNLCRSEFEGLLNNLLKISETEFMINLNKRIVNVINHQYSNKVLDDDTFNQILNKVKNKIYENFLVPVKKIFSESIENYESNIKSSKNKVPSEIFLWGNFLKHCVNDQDAAYHTCGGKFILIYSNYREVKIEFEKKIDPKIKIGGTDPIEKNLTFVICINCKEGFSSENITMFCETCSCIFKSNTVKTEDFNSPLSTWENYHCGALINATLKCIQCKTNPFRLNLKTKFLDCRNCNISIDPLTISWKCFICSEDFAGNPKIYNLHEFEKIKIAIENAVIEKKEIFPFEVPCCNVDFSVVKLTHKKKCSGVLYEGLLDFETIVVCGLCRAMNYYSNFIWTCPTCFKKFSLDKAILNVIETDTLKKKEKKETSPTTLRRGILNSTKFQDKIQKLNSEATVKKPKNIKFKNPNHSKNTKSNVSYLSEDENLAVYETIKGISILRYSKILNKTSNLDLENINSSTENRKEFLTPRVGNPKIALEYNNERFNKNIKSTLKNYEVQKPNKPQNSKSYSGKRKNLTENLEKNCYEFMNPFKRTHKEIQSKFRNQKIFEETLKKSRFYSPKEKRNGSEKGLVEKNSNIESSENNEINTKLLLENLVSSDCHYLSMGKYQSTEHSIPQFVVEDFKIVSQIGEGAFGCIYLVTDPSNEQYAIKKIIIREKDKIDYIVNEFDISYQYKHPNILTILGKCLRSLDSSTKVLYVLMELGHCDWKKDISSRAQNNKKYKESQLMKILKNIVSALSFLQINGVAHRDIKPQNILIMKNSTIKVSDFGCAKQLNSNSFNTLRGTELFISPAQFEALKNNQEVLEHNVFKSDVYSLGLCLLYAATLNLESINSLRMVSDPLECYNILKENLKNDYSKKFIKLVSRMLDLNEDLRFDFIELQKHIE